ncbi:uncharacterized protein EI90DRAFT_3046640 [Cantharellus anzutake]|uniref:uncharacterized protein n=1 Tax=Cantharellus anzutake TaxID=1750568 RepID=UPI0019082C4A|nr:uncharacterized protein EI90DRAFT_3046640 [Cantharellus anzutake]KAF8336649.1 hypothetical protein EI90DRAFT_3046640 [Cantharellus anzutake]
MIPTHAYCIAILPTMLRVALQAELPARELELLSYRLIDRACETKGSDFLFCREIVTPWEMANIGSGHSAKAA